MQNPRTGPFLSPHDPSVLAPVRRSAGGYAWVTPWAAEGTPTASIVRAGPSPRKPGPRQLLTGHHWRRLPGKGPLLVPAGAERETYGPLRDDRAFEAFDALSRQADDDVAALGEAILRFAGQHGELGVGLTVPRADGGPWVTGELFSEWQAELVDFRDLRSLRLALADASKSELARQRLAEHLQDYGPHGQSDWAGEMLIVDPESEAVSVDGYRFSPPSAHPGTYFFYGGTRMDLAGRRWPPSRIAEAAAYGIEMAVNAQLQGRFITRVVAGRIHHLPANLLAAIYYRFAIELTTGVDFRVCKTCNTPFQPLRSDQLYCKPACRWKAAYTARRKADRERQGGPK